MNLKDTLVKLFEENNIKVAKLKGRQRTLYKVNGSLLYITFKERVGEETESENYYLQVNKRLVQESIAKEENLTIFVICGSLSQILTIDGKAFLELTKRSKVYRDGNIKFNVLVTKRKADFRIRFTELGIIEANKYINAFDKCSLTDKVASVVAKIQKDTGYEVISDEKKIEIPQIKVIRKEKTIFDEIKVKELLNSGEGDKLEKFILSLFEFWGFEIDKETSGQNGELDVICISPLCIGIECRSTKQNVGVNIIDELNRHIRRYENKNGLSNFIGLIVCDSPTSQLIEDIRTEKRFLISSETIITLMRFTFNYPLSPIEFQYFFREYGDIKATVDDYLKQKLERLNIREAIISIFTNIGEALDYADIRAHLKVLGFRVKDDELEESLIELSSPLINWLEKRENQYTLIFSEKFRESQQQKLAEVLKWLQ
ncbi:MAG: hypothetical protein KAW16_04685 [candidate division Zixibacteria bacterium]|nr:hypothetical protein [candidate division Zixibacteria bacterium]